MNQRIQSVSAQACDSNGNPLPPSGSVDGASIVVFTNGTTGSLNISVACTMNPDGQAQLLYRLILTNLADYEFVQGDGGEIKYFRQASDNVPVLLKFELTLKSASPDPLPVDLKLAIRDSSPNPPNVGQALVTLSTQ